MAEFCLKCFNEMENKNYKKDDVVLSKYPETCEGCGQIKHTVVKVRNKKLTNTILIAVIIANLILWPTLILLLRDSTSHQTSIDTPEEYAYYAAVYAMKNEYLKNPDDAEFQPFEEASIVSDGNNTYAVSMWIKSKNSLGVMVKSDFEILVRYEPENKQWRLLGYTEK